MIVVDVEAPYWVTSVAMKVEEPAKENTVVTLKLKNSVDKICTSVVIVSSSAKTVVADTEVVSQKQDYHTVGWHTFLAKN